MTNSNQWLLAQLTVYTPGLWLLLSVLLTLVLSLFWGTLSPNGRAILVLTRFLMLPYIGLLVGGLSPRFMGLNGLDWLVSFSLGVGLILLILLALTLARITVAIANPLNYGASPTSAPPRSISLTKGIPETPFFSSTLYQIYQSGAEEFHWAFLRGAIWELLLAAPNPPTLPIYWAIWGAVLLALPDIFLTSHTLLHRLLKLVILVTTSILFLYTRNFWFCWMLHTIGWIILSSGFGAQTQSASPDSTVLSVARRRG